MGRAVSLGRGFLLTKMASLGRPLSPSSAVLPLWRTLPSRMRASASRREQRPALAMIFCRRWASGSDIYALQLREGGVVNVAER